MSCGLGTHIRTHGSGAILQKEMRWGEPPSLIRYKSITQGLGDLSFSIPHLYSRPFALCRRSSLEP